MKTRARVLSALLLLGVICSLMQYVRQTEGVGSVGGALTGRVYGYNMYDEAVPLVWARVSAYANGVVAESVSTGGNGAYVMYVSFSLVNVTVEHPGFKSQARMVTISEGGSAQLNFYLERSEIPIPEFETSVLPIMLMSLLAITMALTRGRRRRKSI